MKKSLPPVASPPSCLPSAAHSEEDRGAIWGMQPWQLPSALNRAGTAAGGAGPGGRQALVVALRSAPRGVGCCGPDHPAQPQDTAWAPSTGHWARPPGLIPGSRGSCQKRG